MSLLAFQRRMMEDVLRPLTADESMQEQHVDGTSMTERAEAYIKPNRHLSAFERLEIYNRQYWLRVMAALEEDFPAVKEVIGEELFQELSRQYLAAHPSRSFTLRNLGSNLPAWLAKHSEYAGDLAELAIDVARVEWAYAEAFDLTELPPIGAEEIAALHMEARLILQPYLQLLALSYPVDDLVLHAHKKLKAADPSNTEYTAFGDDFQLPEIERNDTWLAVHRLDLSVYYRQLEREEYVMLSAIANGSSLGGALESAFHESHLDADQQATCIQQWFASWTELGWLCSSQPSTSPKP